MHLILISDTAMTITLIKRRGLIPQEEKPTGKRNRIRQIQHQILKSVWQIFNLEKQHFDIFRSGIDPNCLQSYDIYNHLSRNDLYWGCDVWNKNEA